MRRFSEKERRIIKKLVTIQTYQKTTEFLEENIFCKTMNKNWAICKTKEQLRPEIYWLCLEPIVYKDKVKFEQSVIELYEILSLFKYLIDNRYLMEITFDFRERFNDTFIIHQDKNNLHSIDMNLKR